MVQHSWIERWTTNNTEVQKFSEKFCELLTRAPDPARMEHAVGKTKCSYQRRVLLPFLPNCKKMVLSQKHLMADVALQNQVFFSRHIMLSLPNSTSIFDALLPLHIPFHGAVLGQTQAAHRSIPPSRHVLHRYTVPVQEDDSC